MNYAEFALIRFGSGLSPHHQGPDTPETLLDSLSDETVTQKFPIPSTEEVSALLREFHAARPKKKEDKKAKAAQERIRKKLIELTHSSRRNRMARAVAAPVGFAERLAQFWSNHFSMRLAAAHLIPMQEAFQHDVIQKLQMGQFAALLKAATLHPAMLYYLDQNSSVGPRSPFAVRRRKKPGLNENHARELLELHTLGVGDAYNQRDIRQLAELMTGLNIGKNNEFEFNAAKAEPGPETVLGKDYGGGRPPRVEDVTAFLDDVAVHPSTAHFISLKLARHFCADKPSGELVDAMTDRYRATDGNLLAVYEVLVGHEYARESYGQKVRQPWDLMIAGFRSLGLRGDDLSAMGMPKYRQTVVGPLRAMGQVLAGAPQPEGWPEDADSWLTPQLLAARITWGLNMPLSLMKNLPETSEFVRHAIDSDRVAEVEAIVGRAESRPEGIGLVLASPQFNRR